MSKRINENEIKNICNPTIDENPHVQKDNQMNLNNEVATNFGHSYKKRKRKKNKIKEQNIMKYVKNFGYIIKECWLNPKNKKSQYHKYYLKHQREKENSNRRLKRTKKSNEKVETNFIGSTMVEDEYANNFVDDLVDYWKDSYESEHEYKPLNNKSETNSNVSDNDINKFSNIIEVNNFKVNKENICNAKTSKNKLKGKKIEENSSDSNKDEIIFEDYNTQ